MRLAIYPGSFDPITFGHLDLVERSQALFDRLVIAVARNVSKRPLFTVEQRLEMIRDAVADKAWVEIDAFDGLLVDYARQRQASAILRGLRATGDFETEFQMAHMNRRLAPQIQTVFMPTGEEHFFVASHLVREVASFGGDVRGLVPEHVERRLKEKFES